jgi:hypothetical protein
MKIKLISILICTFATTALLAQESNTTIAYSVGFPMGDLDDYIQTSFRGISADYRHAVKSNISVGFHAAWNTFYEEKDRDTYTSDNATLTGKQYRYSNNIPMAMTVTYTQKSDEKLTPYVSLGIGTMYTIRETTMSFFLLEEEAWHFLLQPEIGLQVRTAEFSAFSVALKYNHGFKAGSELSNAQSYLALNVGFVLF